MVNLNKLVIKDLSLSCISLKKTINFGIPNLKELQIKQRINDNHSIELYIINFPKLQRLSVLEIYLFIYQIYPLTVY